MLINDPNGYSNNDTDELTQDGIASKNALNRRSGQGVSGPNASTLTKSHDVDLSDAKLVPSLMIVRTTSYYNNDRLEKKTDEVIARFYETRMRPKLLERVSAQMEAAKQSGFDGTFDILSRKGRRLASLTRVNAPNQETLTIVDPRTEPSAMIRSLIASGATHIMVQTPEQLKKILPIANRMGIEKIYVPEKVFQSIKLGETAQKNAGLLVLMPAVAIASVTSTISTPEEEKKNTGNWISSQSNSPWEDTRLPDHHSKIAQEQRKTDERPVEEENLEISPEQAILLDRIIGSIQEDLSAAIESGKPVRESLMNLDRSSGHLRTRASTNIIQTLSVQGDAETLGGAEIAPVAMALEDKGLNDSITIEKTEVQSKQGRALSAIEKLRASRSAKTLAA